MEAASEPSRPSRRSINKTRVVLYALPYLLILYVLSIGPMYWIIYEAYNLEGSTFAYWFYYPLVKASEIPFVARFLDWYLSFWI